MFWIGYIIIGAVAGVLAGLLGVGGGLVIVPALTFILTAQHLPPNHIMQLALGTSLATIMFTSISRLKSHH
ncbi:MAG: TSUP family transporter, partial [Deltaproteobacteria bacterium]|nr:TSUP family transporter [Deltaproteobacteria bacterium]